SGAVALLVAPAQRAALASYLGRAVICGIRPEDFEENAAQQPAPGRSIWAPLEVVEPMGSEINLYLNIGGTLATARIRSDVQPRENAPHVLDVNMDKAHYFDPTSGMTLV
ncbi:MAG: glycerol-3-phosphate ABC transporter ATP-binding protein, partial [Candidatus Hydrogenedentes bacterium]|nr:glycerol-3-phosphate ABC transporter ATP-binding protein [Candidatus Hydrogenedentota bacterium]